LALAWILAGAGVLAANAQPVLLRPAEFVLANDLPLDLGDFAIPCTADWNGDGLLDLIVGYRSADKIAFYANVGQSGRPAFASYVNIQAGGADIVVVGSSCGAPAPWVCDYDADGKRDLLVGSGSSGWVNFYRNTNSDAAPVLAVGVRLRLNTVDLSVGSRATPFVCDWDEDGRNDLLCGDANGLAHFFRNVGTAQSPVYTSDTLLQAGGTTLSLGIRSALRVCDWDGDGLKDIVATAGSNASWCKNVGQSSAPVLNAPVPLQAPKAGVGLININTSSRMRLDVVDWNKNGILDLLIGDDQGKISYFEGYRFVFRGIAVQPDQSVALTWTSANYLKYNVLAGESPGQIDRLIATNVLSGGNLTAWTNQTSEPIRFYRLGIAP
jgi:hypothetical protein